MAENLKHFAEEDDNPKAVEAIRRWRKAVSLVKNPRRRFRFVVDLARRCEAERLKALAVGNKSTEATIRRWKTAAALLRNPRRRFRFVAELAIQYEAQMRRLEIQPVGHLPSENLHTPDPDKSTRPLRPCLSKPSSFGISSDERWTIKEPVTVSHQQSENICRLDPNGSTRLHRRSSSRSSSVSISSDEPRTVAEGPVNLRELDLRDFVRQQDANLTSTNPGNLSSLHVLRNASPDRQRMIKAEWIFLVSSLALECLSAAFDQVSSPTKPQYALSGMLLAIIAVLVCISELVYNGRKERVVLRKWGILGCFYYPTPRYTLFGSLPEIFGLVASIFQCIFSIVQYDYLRRHHANPIKFSVVLIVFVMCLIGSRLIGKIRCHPQSLPADVSETE